ncbi:uncharacterized protein ATNIH1004_003932 [Aspergillus tanneri]|uniref:Uncharacterized protein n=1 Tax=Aspergillus tanneri TaxID=1220188 RepID=A0A5M9MTX1_9EURO|nr:uncharacterized protein ATNIH1004_003932 [Aspergillus tanneri]KAA8648049.1 hypothetical protein ATNIH1004_003932 [Aspergillus tanneri]
MHLKQPGFAGYVWPFFAEVDLSVGALGQRLSWALSVGIHLRIFQSSSGELDIPCKHLPLARMRKAGWCASEIAMVEGVSATEHYISQMRSSTVAEENGHS